jgi:catechol 2,3-dioxygenase-like lactoylglutathione lyase family enzyme
LLDQLGAYRQANSAVRARGLAHLVTGKDLDGNTAGIAYVGTVCDAKLGVSLSQQAFGTTISALIMAHELGHNFGAAHDGEPGTPCASVNGGFIMAPSVSGFAAFSQCSVASMQPVIESASCVSAAEYADATFDSTSPVAGEAGLPFNVPFVVRSAGNIDLDQVVATITLPAISGYSIESAASDQGSCAISGRTATCSLGTIVAGTTVEVDITGRGGAPANFAVTARVSAANDLVNSNDTASATVAVRSGLDAALTMSASAAQVPLGSQLDVYADVGNLRALAVRGSVLSVTFNQTVLSVSMGGASCTTNAYSVSCTTTEIPAGGTRRLTVRVKATSAGPLFASGNVNLAGDGDYTNNTANASAWVQAERDVEVTGGATTVELGVGSVHEIAYVIRSRGPQPTGDVSLVLSLPSSALLVDSLDAGGAACAQVDAMTWRCEIGALPPGASHGVRLRVHGTRPVNADVHANVETPDDGYTPNNYAGVQLRIDHLVDLAVTMASGGSGVEDAALSGQIALRSLGRQSAVGGSFEIELHTAGILRSATIHAGATCELTSSTRARCVLPAMARNALLFVDYTAVFSEPGSYDVKLTATAPGDSNPENDSMTRAVLVRPHNDIAIAGNVDLPAFLVGQARDKTFTLTIDRRALTSARFVAPHYLPGLRVEAIRADGDASAGICRVDADDGGLCEFTDLAAFARGTVTVTYRAAEGSYGYDTAARVSTAGDVNAANDVARGRAEVQAATDLDLRVAGSVAGPSASTLDLPPIAIANGGGTAFAARLDVTLPADVTLIGISASNAICSGTDAIRCDFDELEPNSTSTVTISVRASRAGSFPAALRVSASNDTNAANDSREVRLEISAAASQAVVSQASAKAKGGGAMEWLGLAFLALLVARKRAESNRWVQPLRGFSN